MNSYYCVRHTMHIKNTKPTTSTQSETESIFLYLLIQMLLNWCNIQTKICLIKPAHKNF